VLDDAAVFLRGAGQEAGHVDERDERDIERIAKRTKRAALREASMSSTPARRFGWFATMPTLRPPMRRTGDDVRREERLQFEEVAVIDGRHDRIEDIVRLVGRVGNQFVELGTSRCGSSSLATSGTSSRLFCGINEMSRRTCSFISSSSPRRDRTRRILWHASSRRRVLRTLRLRR